MKDPFFKQANVLQNDDLFALPQLEKAGQLRIIGKTFYVATLASITDLNLTHTWHFLLLSFWTKLKSIDEKKQFPICFLF